MKSIRLPEFCGDLLALSTDELLFICNESLHALSLRTGQLSAHEHPTLSHLRDMALDTRTGTLLFAERVDNWQLVSLRCEASKWLEVQRRNITLGSRAVLLSVCDSRVLVVGIGDSGLVLHHMFDITAQHNLIGAGPEVQQRLGYNLACTRRDNDTLIATDGGGSVSLQRLATGPLRLEHIATSQDVAYIFKLLFRGELLLVADWKYENNTHKRIIQSFRATPNALTERRVLLHNVSFFLDWTLAGDRLVLADTDSNLLVYDFV